MMYLQHFGLTHSPLGKQCRDLWDDGQLEPIRSRFQWLLDSPGLGLLSGEAGVGKTAVLRQLTAKLSPHRYQVIYMAETDFGRLDLYRHLALALGLEPAFRRAQLWRDIKARIQDLYEQKQVLPLWIIDEAQNLPREFFRDFPAFLNFAFDARDMMTVWLVGLPELAFTLERAPQAALASRIQVRLKLDPILERDRFHALIRHALKDAGSAHNLLADTGMEMLRQASQGRPRQAGTLIRHALRLACLKGMSHLPDELIQQAIEEHRA
jgi:MSHA biogenesis protein MshM